MNTKYDITLFGVKVEQNLRGHEIDKVQNLWKELRDQPDFLHKNWTDFKEELGLVFFRRKWKIKSKEKWLWAKIKYAI